MIRVAAVLALACAAACGGQARENAPAAALERPATADARGGAGSALAGRDCGRAGGDSALAVCLAENEIERVTSEYAEAHGIERHGDTICVRTWPDRKRAPAMVDGEGAVEVAGGKVIASLTGDSVPCPQDAARVHAAHWGTKENDVD